VLFSFAEGAKISNLSAETHFTIGETMARLHSATRDFDLRRVTYTADVLIRQPMNRLEQFLPATTEEMQYMRRLETFLCEAFGQFDTSQLRTGAVHLDIWFDNMNVHEDGTVTLFDFDFCGNGWLCHDVAYYLLQLNNVERDPLECEKKTNSFLAGYESLVELTAEERRMLPVLGISTYCFYLGIQCQRFDNWSNVFLSEDYLKRFVNGLVKRFADMHHLQV
jgi:Ser/Thr protein kinase RdoA (MazF antagonist)